MPVLFRLFYPLGQTGKITLYTNLERRLMQRSRRVEHWNDQASVNPNWFPMNFADADIGEELAHRVTTKGDNNQGVYNLNLPFEQRYYRPKVLQAVGRGYRGGGT